MEYKKFAEAQGVQRRALASGELRIAGDEFAIAGYAAKYGVLSHDLGGFREKIAAGTFNRSLMERADVMCLMNHDPNEVLGRTTNGSLRLESDATGLRYYCRLNPNSQRHKDVYQNVLTGLMNQCSFAFTVPQGGDLWETGCDNDGKECQIRTLKDIDLLDVSCVTYPAYPETSVDARKMGYDRKQRVGVGRDWRKDPETPEEFLRAAAYSMGKSLLALAERECGNCAGGGDDRFSMGTIRGHMNICSQMLECTAATAETIEGIMDGWPDDEDDSIRKVTSATYQARRKKFRELHREFHRMVGETCKNHALMRLSAKEILD